MILKGVVFRSVRKWHFKRHLSTDWKGVVGLEVHVQIASQSKLFSSAPTTEAPANSNVALFDAAIPGTLPVLNRRCVEAAVQTALALNCEKINKVMRFDRKHYFYADMPAGYQITQQFHPVARNGKLTCFVQRSRDAELEKVTCRIHQLQLEQDSGKSIHDPNDKASLVDLNRAGVGLLEIVFKPDLSCGEEAASLVKDLVAIVRTIGVSSGRMEDGALRVDANISVHKPGTPLGTRTEVKNMNSVRSVKHAIDYEIQRQIECLEAGTPISNVTMTYDNKAKCTVVMRDKEITQDYRFFPEPNLPVVDLDQVGISISKLRKKLPALPSEHRQKLIDTYKLKLKDSIFLLRESDFFELFHETMLLVDAKYAPKVSHLLITGVMSLLTQNSLALYQTKLTSRNFAQLIMLKETRKVGEHKCVEILKQTMIDGSEPKEILEKNDWFLITDVTLISALCDEAMALHPKEVGKVLGGKMRAMNKMLAHVRRATDSRVDMKLVERILQDKIKASNGIKEEIQIGR